MLLAASAQKLQFIKTFGSENKQEVFRAIEVKLFSHVYFRDWLSWTFLVNGYCVRIYLLARSF